MESAAGGQSEHGPMSATGRGSERIESDNYPTPPWCVRRMLEAAPWDATAQFGSVLFQPKILEPCAAEGLVVRELRDHMPRATISAIELRDVGDLRGAGADFWGTADALSEDLPWSNYDLVLTNPPFSLWHEFAAKALKHSNWTALLLRIGAVAHLEGLPTPSLYPLPDRPIFAHKVSFSCGFSRMIPWNAETPAKCGDDDHGDGNHLCGGLFVKRQAQSDASEYAWLVWGPQKPTVHVLAKTPLAERKQLVRLAE